MKITIKFLGIIAITAVIGFSFTSCDLVEDEKLILRLKNESYNQDGPPLTTGRVEIRTGNYSQSGSTTLKEWDPMHIAVGSTVDLDLTGIVTSAGTYHVAIDGGSGGGDIIFYTTIGVVNASIIGRNVTQ